MRCAWEREVEMLGIAFYEVTALAVAAFVIYRSHRAAKRYSQRVKYLIELEDYCLELRHRYGKRRVLSDAVFASFDPKRKRLRDFSYGMTRTFGNDRAEGMTARSYGEMLSEPYEKLLVSVCGLVDEYGDGGEGSFEETVLKIVIDIREERRHLAKRAHGFKGLAATAAIPCLFVRALGNWGIDTIPSLLTFYHGRGGTYLRCIILILSFMCGVAVEILADPGTFRDSFVRLGKRAGELLIPGRTFKTMNGRLRTRLDKLDIRIGVGKIRFLSFAFAALFFVVSFVSVVFGHIDMKHDYVFDTSDIENSLGVADSATINAARRVIPKLMENTTGGVAHYTDDELIGEITEAGVRSMEDAALVAMEYRKRLTSYGEEKIDFSDLAFILIVGAIGWFMPLAAVAVLGIVMDSRVKEEVMQFEAVIDMEKDVNGMTVPIMLESMLCFASVTRGALIKTIMDYNTNEERAFNHLCEFGDDRSIGRLAVFFKMTDMLGIKHAFDEVSAELDGMREERSLDRSIRLEDEVMLAGILGILPGGVVVFGYLLVPFIARALEMFNSYSDSLGMI